MFSIRKPRSWSSVSRFEVRDPGFGLVNLFALKVLFVDALISLGDVASDFAQGLALLRTDGLEVFGLITVAINWLPGVVAAVHLVSMYRTRHHWRWILLWAGTQLPFFVIMLLTTLLLISVAVGVLPGGSPVRVP